MHLNAVGIIIFSAIKLYLYRPNCMISKLKKFIQLSFEDKLFYLETFGLLLFSKLLILFIPLRKVAPYLGDLNGEVRKELSSGETLIAEKIMVFICKVGNNMPWKSVCLDQALACMILLKKKKIPYSLYLGVKKDEANQKLMAHAWVLCGDKILIGGRRSLQFTVVARFTKNF